MSCLHVQVEERKGGKQVTKIRVSERIYRMMDGESPLVQWRCGDGRKMIKGMGKLGQAEKRKEAVDGTATVDGSVRKFANCLCS